MLQEVLLAKVTLPTFGTLEGFLPSVFPARKRGHRGVGTEGVFQALWNSGPPPAPARDPCCVAEEEVPEALGKKRNSSHGSQWPMDSWEPGTSPASASLSKWLLQN